MQTRTRPSRRTRPETTPVIHRILEENNGRAFERELVHPHHFIRDRFIDLTAMKLFLAPWIREEVRKTLIDEGKR